MSRAIHCAMLRFSLVEVDVIAALSAVAALLVEARADQGLEPDPIGAYRSFGYSKRIVAERAGG